MFMLLQRPVRLSAILVATVLVLPSWSVARGDVVVGTFEDQNPGSNTFKNDFRPTNSFTTGGFSLNNNFSPTFSAWSGFSVSSKVDNAFGGSDFSHEYGAYAPTGANGTGAGGSATYGVAFNFSQGDSLINLPSGVSPFSIDITNTTYTAQAISLGDGFARAFHQGDFFRLDILGYSGLNGTGTQVGDVPFYLADFRGTSLVLVSDWTTVSLASLADAQSLAFNMTSTDVGDFGINTPTFFAVDNLVGVSAVPEPSSIVLCGIGITTAGLYSLKRRRRV
jgi:Domain of unknown function (DUF4465)